MRAPSGTKWGNVYSTNKSNGNWYEYRMGLYCNTVSETETNVTVDITVYLQSRYKAEDTNVNVFYRIGEGIATAYDDKHTYKVKIAAVDFTGEIGSEWNNNIPIDVNVAQIHKTSHTFYRGTAKKVLNIYAHVGDLVGYTTKYPDDQDEASGGLITVCTSITIPALPTYTITYNANGGTGAPQNDTKTHGVTLKLDTAVPTRTNYTFKGWGTSASDTTVDYAAGANYTANAPADLYAIWQVNTYTNTIIHLAYGWKNGEGDSENNKDCFKLGEDTFDCEYGTQFTLSESPRTTRPNGFYLADVGTSSVTGSWEKYPINSKITQQAKAMSFEYYYYPHDYTITYNHNGGSFDVTHPEKYNVLYEVLFPTPKREGYSFVGWYIEDSDIPVSGINVGTNATFKSAEDLYAELETRRVGDVTVTAKWSDNGIAHVKKDGVWKKGQIWIKQTGVWKRGIPWIKTNGKWERAGK